MSICWEGQSPALDSKIFGTDSMSFVAEEFRFQHENMTRGGCVWEQRVGAGDEAKESSIITCSTAEGYHSRRVERDWIILLHILVGTKDTDSSRLNPK